MLCLLTQASLLFLYNCVFSVGPSFVERTKNNRCQVRAFFSSPWIRLNNWWQQSVWTFIEIHSRLFTEEANRDEEHDGRKKEKWPLNEADSWTWTNDWIGSLITSAHFELIQSWIVRRLSVLATLNCGEEKRGNFVWLLTYQLDKVPSRFFDRQRPTQLLEFLSFFLSVAVVFYPTSHV